MRFGAPWVLALPLLTVACGPSSGADSASGASADGGGNACGLHTQYKGDELCIPPPAPGEGIQIHVGPSSYDDPTAVQPYMVPPNEENVACFNAVIPESNFYYLRQKNRMRSGSHHMLIFAMNDPSLVEGPAPSGCSPVGAGTGGGMVAMITGSQTPSRDFPGELAPEDQGMAYKLPQANMAAFQLHYINTSTEPVLREAWVNLYKEPESAVTQQLHDIFMVADLAVAIPPHTQADTTLTLTPNLPGPTRIYGVSAHMHAHAEHFTLWHVSPGQADQVVYESFNWEDPYQAGFSTVIQNPTQDAQAKQDGAISGDFYLQPGDSFRWSCHVNNTLDTTLNFRNEALTGEMCMLVGNYIGPTGGLLAGACSSGSCFSGIGN